MSNTNLTNNDISISEITDIILSNNPDANIDLITEAYEHAYNAHKDQYRLSGEPYIVHPLEVAAILANLTLDTTAIAAALLHDVVEDTLISIENIKKKFGEEIALLVDGVTKISSLKKQTKYTEQAHSLRKMLIATTNDVRVIIIKLADKLHNMRTIHYHPLFKRRQISKEVLDIYAPMAIRLGMTKIGSELEDLAFMVLYPDKYKEILKNVVQKKQEIEEYINRIQNLLQVKLLELQIKANITGRAKHYYSIFRKMELRKKSFDDIFDIRAIRITTDTVKDCYGILGIIHTLWSPITARFKDYIAVPKSNMYQSLHTTVIGPDGHPLEIQIRTKEMHATSQNGIAAHWLYKEKSSELPSLSLIKNIQKRHLDTDDPKEFMKQLKMDLYEDEIFTFTPKGKIIKLAKGSTPIDFAYAIHTEVGNHCIGAKVNRSIAPLKKELKSGDIVEIHTSKKGRPSKSWLKIVKSSNARYKIRNWLRKHEDTHQDSTTKILQREEAQKSKKTIEVSIPDNELIKVKNISKHKKDVLSIDGTTNIMLKLSQCCQPIPGDDIIGFITRGRGLTIHKKNCPSLKRLNAEKERFINIVWESSQNTYPVKIAIHAIDRANLLKDIADEIALLKTNIIKMEAHLKEKDNVIFNFVLEVRSVEHLNDIIKKLKLIKNITHIYKLKEKFLTK